MSPLADLVRVHRMPGERSRGLLTVQGLLVPCALGRGGVTRRKREGDGATPIGNFALRQLYYRADRMPRPVTGLPASPITPALGWSDDPADPLYNSVVRLPHRFGHERMWRDDGLYDYVVAIGHNDQPARRPLGSAIFLHLAREGLAPTEGCVAISPQDMARLLPRLGPGTRLMVAG